MERKNPKFFRSLQNAQRDTTNLAVKCNNFLNNANIALTASCEHCIEFPPNLLGYPINAKSPHFCKISPFEFGQEQT